MQAGSCIRCSIGCAPPLFPSGLAEPGLTADPGTAAVRGRFRPVVQTGVGRSSPAAGGPRPRRALRSLLSGIDGQLVVGRIAVPAGGRRRPREGGRGPEGGAPRSAEQGGGAGPQTGWRRERALSSWQSSLRPAGIETKKGTLRAERGDGGAGTRVWQSRFSAASRRAWARGLRR